MTCFRYAVFTMNSATNGSFHWYAHQSNSASTCWEKWKHVDGQNFEFQWKLKGLILFLFSFVCYRVCCLESLGTSLQWLTWSSPTSARITWYGSHGGVVALSWSHSNGHAGPVCGCEHVWMCMWYKSAGRGGAAQASYDKVRHRNCFQTPRKHFQINISWGQRSVDAITGLHRPQKKHSPRSEFTPELRRWISKLTTSHLQILHQEIFGRFYTKFLKSFDHLGKPKKKWLKNSFEKWKKEPELPRRSVSKFDQDVFDYALEDAFVKVANVKWVRNFRHDAQSDPQVDIYSAP